MHALLICSSSGDGSAELVRGLAPRADVVIAVDGGGSVALAAEVAPDVVLGDFDSLAPGDLRRLELAGATLVRFPADKDETDLELALRHAADLGATAVTLTSAAGGRLDHLLAVVGSVIAHVDLAFDWVEPEFCAWAVAAGARDRLAVGGSGAIISLIAPSSATVSVHGVKWPLEDAVLDSLSSLGVSNIVDGEATISVTSGAVLVIAPQDGGQGAWLRT